MQGNVVFIPAYLQSNCKYAGIIILPILCLSFLNVGNVYLTVRSEFRLFIYIW